jgi:hypothetical protein
MSTGLSVIQSDRQCLYIGGHVLLRVKSVNRVIFANYYQTYYALLHKSVYYIIMFTFLVFCFAHETFQFFLLNTI